MEQHSLDTSDPNSFQMGTYNSQQFQPEQHSGNSNPSSQNIDYNQDAPTSFSRDMFPPPSQQSNEKDILTEIVRHKLISNIVQGLSEFHFNVGFSGV